MMLYKFIYDCLLKNSVQRYTFFIVQQNKWIENCTKYLVLCTHLVFCAMKKDLEKRKEGDVQNST